MRRTATPAEVAGWHEQLEPHMPEERAVAAVGLLSEVVADCPVCEEPVRRCDPRRRVGEHLRHLRCAGELASPNSRRAAA